MEIRKVHKRDIDELKEMYSNNIPHRGLIQSNREASVLVFANTIDTEYYAKKYVLN